jgi:hypothetical protein
LQIADELLGYKIDEGPEAPSPCDSVDSRAGVSCDAVPVCALRARVVPVAARRTEELRQVQILELGFLPRMEARGTNRMRSGIFAGTVAMRASFARRTTAWHQDGATLPCPQGCARPSFSSLVPVPSAGSHGSRDVLGDPTTAPDASRRSGGSRIERTRTVSRDRCAEAPRHSPLDGVSSVPYNASLTPIQSGRGAVWISALEWGSRAAAILFASLPFFLAPVAPSSCQPQEKPS